jgi:transposase-like protein
VINTDGHAAYPPAVAQLKAEGALAEDCRHRPVPYLNNVLEQDHRAIKRRVNASQHFRSFWGAWRTIAGYELRLSNSPFMQWRGYQRRPDHVTTTDFQSALSEDHHRPALRLALSKYPSLKQLS